MPPPKTIQRQTKFQTASSTIPAGVGSLQLACEASTRGMGSDWVRGKVQTSDRGSARKCRNALNHLELCGSERSERQGFWVETPLGCSVVRLSETVCQHFAARVHTNSPPAWGPCLADAAPPIPGGGCAIRHRARRERIQWNNRILGVLAGATKGACRCRPTAGHRRWP